LRSVNSRGDWRHAKQTVPYPTGYVMWTRMMKLPEKRYRCQWRHWEATPYCLSLRWAPMGSFESLLHYLCGSCSSRRDTLLEQFRAPQAEWAPYFFIKAGCCWGKWWSDTLLSGWAIMQLQKKQRPPFFSQCSEVLEEHLSEGLLWKGHPSYWMSFSGLLWQDHRSYWKNFSVLLWKGPRSSLGSFSEATLAGSPELLDELLRATLAGSSELLKELLWATLAGSPELLEELRRSYFGRSSELLDELLGRYFGRSSVLLKELFISYYSRK